MTPDPTHGENPVQQFVKTGLIHGKNCPKSRHTGTGYLHSEDFDGPYLVDGTVYCGRCHHTMSQSEIRVARNLPPTKQPTEGGESPCSTHAACTDGTPKECPVQTAGTENRPRAVESSNAGSPTSNPEANRQAQEGTPRRQHLVQSAGYWFAKAREQQKMPGHGAEAVFAMENAYNHVENALAASRDETQKALEERDKVRDSRSTIIAERDKAQEELAKLQTKNANLIEAGRQGGEHFNRLMAERDKLKIERDGALHSGENWELLHAKRQKELAAMTKERDVAQQPEFVQEYLLAGARVKSLEASLRDAENVIRVKDDALSKTENALVTATEQLNTEKKRYDFVLKTADAAEARARAAEAAVVEHRQFIDKIGFSCAGTDCENVSQRILKFLGERNCGTALRAENESLARRVWELENSLRCLEHLSESDMAKIRAKAVAALGEYASHWPYCYQRLSAGRLQCNCGYNQALAELRGEGGDR